MAEHMQDEEQIEAIKQWWQENKVSVVAAFVIAVGGTLGWSQYTDYSATQAAEAANRYDTVIEQKDTLGTEELASLVNDLRENHDGSVYADFASMQLASAAVAEGDYDLAAAQLTEVVGELDPSSTMGQMAQLRLARVLAAAGREEEAIRILEMGSASFPVSFAQALGDIHLAAGRESEALEAYRMAQSASLDMGRAPGFLELKVTALELRLSGAVASEGVLQ